MSKLIDKIEEIRKNLPENFSLELDNNPGLYYWDGKNGLQRICNPIAVTAIKRKPDGSGYGKEITFWAKEINNNGKERTAYILNKNLSDEKALPELADLGLDVPASLLLKKQLIQYLNKSWPCKLLIELEKPGWTNSDYDSYICPSFAISKTEDQETSGIILSNSLKTSGFGMRGTLEDWQTHICQYCENNKYPTHSLCIGLSSMILRPLNLNGALYNFTGRSSIGKTTNMYIAGSLFGDHSFVKAWRLTDNGLEGMAECRNDSLLILDELSQCDSKFACANIYMLPNGSGKARSDKNGNPKPIKTWTINTISSGELGLAEQIIEAGQKQTGGQSVRAIDIVSEIPNGYGIYSDLHGFSSGSELSNWFKEKTKLYYGVPAYMFAKGLIKSDGLSIVKDIYGRAREMLYVDFGLKEANGQVLRIADEFAGHIAAGELASSDALGILTHSAKAIENAVKSVFSEYLDRRGSISDSREEILIINHIRESLERSVNNLAVADPKTKTIVSDARSYDHVLGVVADHKESNKKVYYIFPDLFREKVCKNFSADLAKKILKEKGYLKTDKDGSNKKCPYEGEKFEDKRMVKLIFSND